MRFFSGSRGSGGDKKRLSPSELFKNKMLGKVVEEKTPAEKYKEMIESKMQKMMEDAIMGRKKATPRIPGTKAPTEEPEKALSKNAKNMLKLLAMQKAKKEQKREKRKQREQMWAEKAKKRAAEMAKAAKDQALYEEQRQRDEAVASAAAAAAAATAAAEPQHTYSHSYTNNDDSSGW